MNTKMIPAPHFKVGDVVEIRGSRYSFKISEIVLQGNVLYFYRGSILKDGRFYKFATVDESYLYKSSVSQQNTLNKRFK